MFLCRLPSSPFLISNRQPRTNRVERDGHGDLDLRLDARSSSLVVTPPRSAWWCRDSSASLPFLLAGSTASLCPAAIHPHFRRWRFYSSDSGVFDSLTDNGLLCCFPLSLWDFC